MERLRYGVVGLVALGLVVTVAFAGYNGSFQSTFEVTVHTPRTGLGLVTGSDVAYRGVTVGRVKEISTDPDGGAVLKVVIFRDRSEAIPAAVQAYIDSSTLFGPKSVQLRAPRRAADTRLGEGDVVEALAVSPEFNGLYDQVYTLVTAIDVGKLNAALSSVAATLEGRGDEIGALVGDLQDYVEVVNRHLPAIKNDIRLGREVVDDYSVVADDLLAVTENAADIGATLVEVRPTINTFLLSLIRSTSNADLLVREIDEPLIQSLAVLRPSLDLFGDFSPMFGCLLKGLNEARKRVEAVMGSTVPAVQADVLFLPGQRGYRTEDSLPKSVAGIGPHCYGLPMLTGEENPAPHYLFDDGTIPTWTGSEGDEVQPSLDSLFGVNLGDLLGTLGTP